MSKSSAAAITLTISYEHAVAISEALALYTNIGRADLTRIHELYESGFIPDLTVDNTEKRTANSEQLLELLKEAESIVGQSDFRKLGIGNEKVPTKAKLAWETNLALTSCIRYHDRSKGNVTEHFKPVLLDNTGIKIEICKNN